MLTFSVRVYYSSPSCSLLFGRRLGDQCFLLLLVHLGQFPLQLHQFP